MKNKWLLIKGIVGILSLFCSGLDIGFFIRNLAEKEYWLALLFLFFGIVLFKNGFGYWKSILSSIGWIGRDMEQ